MTIVTMRAAFMSALEDVYALAGNSSPGRPEEAVVSGDDTKMMTVRREEFLVDDDGVEIGGEFVVGWDGIGNLEMRDGILNLTLTDGKKIMIEGCP